MWLENLECIQRLSLIFILALDGPIPLGKLHINKLSQLTRIGGSIAPSHVNPTLADLDGDSDTEDPVSGLCVSVR